MSLVLDEIPRDLNIKTLNFMDHYPDIFKPVCYLLVLLMFLGVVPPPYSRKFRSWLGLLQIHLVISSLRFIGMSISLNQLFHKGFIINLSAHKLRA